MIRTTIASLAVSAFAAFAVPASHAGDPPVAPSKPAAPAQPAQPAAPAWPSDEKGLNQLGTKLVESLFRAVEAKDVAALEGIMQPGFQHITFQGAYDRAGAIEMIKGLDAKSSKVTEVHATRAGDALVVTCQVSVQETVPGVSLDTAPTCRLGVWQPVDGAWRLAAWASLNMPSTRPAPAAPRFAGDAELNKQGAAMLSRFLEAQRSKDLKVFDGMIDEHMQVINFRGQKVKADMVRGAEYAKADPATIGQPRATRCGDLTVVTCNLSLGQKVGFTTLPSDQAPFLIVFRGQGEAGSVIATANTNKPK